MVQTKKRDIELKISFEQIKKLSNVKELQNLAKVKFTSPKLKGTKI